MVKTHSLLLVLKNPSAYIEVECSCSYFLGYADKKDLKPSGEPMFKCPKCLERFDVICE